MTERDTTNLSAIEQKNVLFYNDELVAIKANDGQIYVALRQLCDALGLDRKSQANRVRRSLVLSDGYHVGRIETASRGKQRAGLLRYDLVPFWLAGVEISRVREEIRPKLLTYQREVATVLHEAFQDGRLTTDQSLDLETLAESGSPAATAYKTAQAILQIARHQLLLETQLQAQAKEVAANSAELQDHALRLSELEQSLTNKSRTIGQAEASQLSQAVKAVGMALTKKSGRNEFGGVYGELYRRFNITSYKLLPADKFDDAMSFLTQWYATVTDDQALPF